MHSSTICALAALLGAVAAAPVNKRDVVWVTETDIDIVTVAVTETVWVDGPANTAEAVPTWDHTWPGYSAPSASATSVDVAPTTTSVSVYVAPTTSTTPVVVAPTTSSTPVVVAPTTTSSTPVVVAPTTTSSTPVVVVPTTSSTSSSVSIYVAPTTTSTTAPVYVTPTTTTTSAAAASTTASSASGGGNGDLTYYETGLGSCGITSVDTDMIVALAVDMMTANWSGNPNDNPLCNQVVDITWNGITKSATIVDTCEGCSGGSLDCSPSLFEEFADESVGRLTGMTWVYA